MMDFSPKTLGYRTFWVVDKTRTERSFCNRGRITVETFEEVPVDKYDLIARIMDKAALDLWNGWKILVDPTSPDPLGMCGYFVLEGSKYDNNGLFLHCVHAAASHFGVRVDSVVTGAR